MYLREIGVVVAISLVVSLFVPLVIMGKAAEGRMGMIEGLIASGGIALMLYMSTQSFMIIWDESPWTKHKERPRLVGATILSSVGYSFLALLVGILIRG